MWNWQIILNGTKIKNLKISRKMQRNSKDEADLQKQIYAKITTKWPNQTRKWREEIIKKANRNNNGKAPIEENMARKRSKKANSQMIAILAKCMTQKIIVTNPCHKGAIAWTMTPLPILLQRKSSSQSPPRPKLSQKLRWQRRTVKKFKSWRNLFMTRLWN